MEIPPIDGRGIRDSDRVGEAAVAVVSQSFVKRFWPDGPALGRRLRFPLPGSPYHLQWFTVVGIVADAKYRELRGSPSGPLHQLGTVSVRGAPVRRSNGWTARVDRQCRTRGSARHRSDAPDRRCRRAQRCGAGADRQPTARRAHVQRLRGDRISIGRARPGHAHCVAGPSADARDRHSTGARRDVTTGDRNRDV